MIVDESDLPIWLRPTMKMEDLQKCIQKKSNANLGMYIHIPFCRVRCQFCAFYVQTHQEKNVQYFLDGLERELQLFGKESGLASLPVTSVYFGGGTPTALSAGQLGQVLDDIQKWFAVTADAEISVEAHPATVNSDNVKALRSNGFNRLSLGAQSFDDRELLQLGGRSVSQTIQTAMECVRQAGFDNISLDFIYGFPRHTEASWERTLEAAVALQPTHLSCYAFTVEEGSHFYKRVVDGTADVPDEDLQARLAMFTGDYLEAAAYEQYEISNFCKPGFACQQNLRYWQGASYLGCGPSAQSFVSEVRFGNQADLDSYCGTLVQGALPIDHLTILDTQALQREKIVFGLRTTQGVRCDQVRMFSRKNIEWAKAFRELKEQGLLSEEEGYVHLTGRGIRFADTVAVALF